MVGVVSGVLIGALTLDRIGARSVVRTSDRARVLFERDTPYHRVRVIERPPGIRDLFINSGILNTDGIIKRVLNTVLQCHG